jgi:hypothetical protein
MNVPCTAILSIGAAIVCALGLGSALVPGHSLDEVRQDGQVQIAGEVSSEPGQVLAVSYRQSRAAPFLATRSRRHSRIPQVKVENP